jgi:hypothetical protein
MTMQSTLSDTCPTCKYWDRHGTDPYGICRANPPTGSGWPRTSRDDWCGRWEILPTPAPAPLPTSTLKLSKKKA